MLQETLKHWHQNWITDELNWRSTWTGHARAACQVNGWMCRCTSAEHFCLAKLISCMYPLKNKATPFLPNSLLHKSSRIFILMVKGGLEKGSWHMSLFPMASGMCSGSQARLQPSTPGAWQGCVARSCATAHWTCLAAPVGVQGQGGPLGGINGNSKFSFSAWHASLVLLLESKPSYCLGKWKNQAEELNFTF